MMHLTRRMQIAALFAGIILFGTFALFANEPAHARENKTETVSSASEDCRPYGPRAFPRMQRYQRCLERLRRSKPAEQRFAPKTISKIK